MSETEVKPQTAPPSHDRVLHILKAMLPDGVHGLTYCGQVLPPRKDGQSGKPARRASNSMDNCVVCWEEYW